MTLKKKMLQGTSTYCVLLRMEQVTYKGSTVIPTSSVCMKVGSLLYENTCSKWLHVV